MKHAPPKGRRDAGPSQRQLRAGELVRHALADILREEALADPALANVSVTVTEVRMSPDLRHAVCFVEPLGGVHAGEVVAGLNRNAKFLRGRLGRAIELKFTPDLKFVHDESFEEAARIGRLFAQPEVRRDLAPSPADFAPSHSMGQGRDGGEHAELDEQGADGVSRAPFVEAGDNTPTPTLPHRGGGSRGGEGSR